MSKLNEKEIIEIKNAVEVLNKYAPQIKEANKRAEMIKKNGPVVCSIGSGVDKVIEGIEDICEGVKDLWNKIFG